MARRSFDANRNYDKQFGKNANYTYREYTPESLVCDLLKIVPFEKEDFVVDAGSGNNKVWFNCCDDLIRIIKEKKDDEGLKITQPLGEVASVVVK